MFDELHEECGVFGVYQVEEAASLTYYGLHALQHRGQEGCGIAVSDGRAVQSYKGRGLISEVFHGDELAKLQGNIAIGHVRYSTAGEIRWKMYSRCCRSRIAVRLPWCTTARL